MALLHEINNGTQRLSVSSTGQVKINNAFTFPTADGTENYVLKTDGSGTVNWQPDANTGTVTGTGTENKVVRWNATAGEIGNGPITFSSNAATASSTFAGPLFIKTNDDPTLTLENTDDSGNPVITFKSNTLITVEGAQLFYVNSVGAFHITTTYPNNAAAIVFNTGTGTDQGTNNERMRITGNGAIEIKGSSTTASAQAFITNDNSLLSIGSSVSGSVVKDIQFSSPSAMMYIEGATGNVGIGTVSPSDLYADQLVVKCSSSENGITILSNSTTDANYLMFADGTSGSDRFRGQIKYNHQSNFMAFGTDAVEKMRISSTGLTTIKRTGITGAAKADMTLQIGFEGNDGQNNLIGFGYNGGTNIPAYIGYSSTSGSENTKGDLYFATRSVTTDTQPTNRMVVKASGDVGIGTAEPDSLLNVESASINTAILTLGCTKNDDSWTLGDKIGAVNFFSADTSGPGALVRGSMALVAEATNGADMGLSFSTYNNTERVRITATGKMAIGRTIPAAKLDIKGDGGVTGLTFRTTDVSNNEIFYIMDGGRVGVRFYPFLIGVPSTTSPASGARFQVATTGGDFVVLNDGKVGIGTDSPVKKLHVSDTATGLMTNILCVNRHDTNGDTAGIAFSMTDNDLFNKAGIIFERKLSQGRGNLHLCNNNVNGNANFTLADAALTVEYTGNVGIGTTSPDAKLEVASGQAKTVTSGVEFARFGTSNEASNYATLTGEVKGGANAAARKWIFQTIEAGVANAGNIAFQPSGGNVGIGTDSPATQLEIFNSGTSVLTLSHDGGGGSGSRIDFNLKLAAVSQPVTAQIKAIDDGAFRSDIIFTTKTAATENSGLTERVKISANGRLTINNVTPPSNFAQLNIGYTAGGETRAIDIKGSWNTGESKSITFTYSTSAPSILGQINCVFNNPSASIRWGKLYYNGPGTTYTMELKSTGLTTADLTVAGSITAAGDVVAFSDKKLKKNIKTLDGSKVYKMRGVSFDRIDTGKKSSGVIAQEMQEVAPELVNESGDTLGVAYGNISGYLIEAIKELKQEIEKLKNKPCNCNCK